MPVFSSGLEEKTTFAKDDMLLIGDSEANDTTRKIKVGTLLAGAGGGGGTAPSFDGFPVVVINDISDGFIDLEPNKRTIVEPQIDDYLIIQFNGDISSFSNEYSIMLKGGTNTQLEFGTEIYWQNGNAPVIAQGEVIEINIVGQFGLYVNYGVV